MELNTNLDILEAVFKEYIDALGGSPEYLAPYAYMLLMWQNTTGVKRVHKETLMRQWENGEVLPPELRERQLNQRLKRELKQ